MMLSVETLPLRPPFDWEGLLSFFAPRAIPGVEAVEARVLRRSFRKGPQVGVLEAQMEGAELHLRVWSEGDTGWLRALAAKVFDTELNPNDILKQLGGDATLGPLLAKWPGVRLPGAWDGFEMGVRAILGQQVSVKAAHTLAGRLVARYGHDYPTPFPSVTKLFPLAEELAALPVPELASIGITQKRAETLGHFARWSALAEAERGPLLDLPGIGPWTESYLRMRGLSDADAFPAGDLGIQKALGIVGLGPLKAAREAELRSQPWRPYRAYAVFLLWRSLSLEGEKK